MSNFYHSLTMWIPFVLLFSGAVVVLEVIGNIDAGYVVPYLFVAGTCTFILYSVSFFPLTLLISKFVKSLLFKGVFFTLLSGGVGAIVFENLSGWFL